MIRLMSADGVNIGPKEVIGSYVVCTAGVTRS